MPVKTVPGDPNLFMDHSEPIRYLGLCCGGSLHMIETLAAHGRYFDQIYLCDNDDIARMSAIHEIQRIAQTYDEQFSPLLKADIYEGLVFHRLPQDITKFAADDFVTLSEVNFVMATPDCQPFSMAGNRLGFADPRSTSFVASLNIIFRLSSDATRPLNYVIENVPGATSFAAIVEALGMPLKVHAHLLGSAARRDTILWTNCRSLQHLRAHLHNSQKPIYPVGALLANHGFDARWQAPPHSAETNFPKFVSRIGSHAYRMHGDEPGKGMLLYDGTFAEPDCSIRAAAMGFSPDHLTCESLSTKDRHRLLGACLDGNICKWLTNAIHSPTASAAAFSSEALSDYKSKHKWTIIFDTGATSHMWGDLTEFSSYEDFSEGPIWVNGISCYAFGQGTVDVNILNKNKSVPITLSKVLYVPELHKHLGAPIRLLSWTAVRMTAPLSELHSTSTASVIRLPDKS